MLIFVIFLFSSQIVVNILGFSGFIHTGTANFGEFRLLDANYSLICPPVTIKVSSKEPSYTAKDLAVLEGLDAVRKRQVCTSDRPIRVG